MLPVGKFGKANSCTGLSGQCLACRREYDAQRRAAPNFYESRRDYDAEWRAKNRDQVREYDRFWSEAKRRERGARRYNLDRKPPERVSLGSLPAQPLAEKLEALARDRLIEDVCAEAGIDPKQFRDWQTGKIKRVQPHTADRVLTNLGINRHDIWEAS